MTTPDASLHSNGNGIVTALELHAHGYWVIATVDKRPIGRAWGEQRWDEEKLKHAFRDYPSAGPGICFGPGKAPNGEWLADAEGDGEQARQSLAILIGCDDPDTVGWTSTRGTHNLFTVDGDRLLSALQAAGAKEEKGSKAGVWKLPELPDLEIRIGGLKSDGSVKQIQSVCPPTNGTDGKPRVWLKPLSERQPQALPEYAYAFLEGVADSKRQDALDSALTLTTPASSVDSYARAALDKECSEVESTPSGGRNNRLNSAAFSLGQFIGAGALVRTDVERALTEAATRCGLLNGEAAATIRSGINDGILKPRDLSTIGSHHNGTGSPGRGSAQACAAGQVNEASDDPHRLARIHVAKFQHDGHRTLRFYRGEWLEWSTGAYRPMPESELRSGLSKTVKDEFDRLNQLAVLTWEKSGGNDASGKPVDKAIARKVTRNLVSDVVQALQSTSILPGKVESPSWVDGPALFEPTETVPTLTALVSLPDVAKLLPQRSEPACRALAATAVIRPTPRFFSTYALNFAFDLNAAYPIEWMRFLTSLWDTDLQSIEALQEFFGYCLTPDTRQQKILGVIGPKRAGKDTIARVLTALVGGENVAGPTLASLSGDFGLASLIGKPLAIVSDARISKKSDAATIVERLLTISGEGRVTIDRKFIEAWTGKLSTRFVLISNELPQLSDSSGALAGRMILLRLTKSFYGKEDLKLFDRLIPELPGILIWAMEGWHRLRERGRFVQPKSGADLLESLEELSSPMIAFTRDRCELGTAREIETKVLFDAWVDWCTANGQKRPGTTQWFARDLRAACSQVSTYNTTRAGTQVRLFSGIDLKAGF
jgi:putative DNA primase/helicase